MTALFVGCGPGKPPSLALPDRQADAPGGSELGRTLRELDLVDREARIIREISEGNVPAWMRSLLPVELRGAVQGEVRQIKFWVTPDYLAVGAEDDFLRIPLSPSAAQRVGDLTGTSLPTTAMVDAVWEAARVRLGPSPIPPNRYMTTLPVFEDHQRKVQRQRDRASAAPGALVAGHKKDVVRTPHLDTLPDRVAIYGWHHLTGEPIQQLYLGHTDDWVDYSHGIRLVWDTVEVDGTPVPLSTALTDPEVALLLTPEGSS